MANHEPTPRQESGDITRVEIPKTKKTPDNRIPEETEKDLLKVRQFLVHQELPALKEYLKERGGEIGTISSVLRSEAEKNIGKISRFKNPWNISEVQSYIEQCIKNDSYVDAVKFIESNEQYIIEMWVEDLLSKKLYHQARALLLEYSETRPYKQMDETEIALDHAIDLEILGGVRAIMDDDVAFGNVKLDARHDRIWSAIHHGYFQQAVEMCDQLDQEVYPRREATKRVNVQHKPAVKLSAESPAEIDKRHQAEFIAALPSSREAILALTEDLPQIVSRFHHLSDIDNGDENFIGALKEQSQLLIQKLIEQKKFIVKPDGTLPVQENLLDYIDQLGDLDLYLYVDPTAIDHKLYLLSSAEAEKRHYRKIALIELEPNDIRIDDSFDKISDDGSEVTDDRTVVTEPPKYIWNKPVITIMPEAARKLRKSA